MSQELAFLKLGGSLITDKTSPRTARLDVLSRLAQEIAHAREIKPGLSLVLGHGSGSFGHVPAQKYQTRQGVNSTQMWLGFVEVWKEAADLNEIVLAALHHAGLPAIALPASAGMVADNRQVLMWNTDPIEMAMQAGLVPVVYGDVIFDRKLGGTIFSTEDLFVYLANRFRPQSILLAGIEAGIWADFPHRTNLVERITPDNVDQFTATLGESAGTDVTGGMASKVEGMLHLVRAMPELKIRVFSGLQPGSIKQALTGEPVGTLVCAG
jgi:isopentenyl phosphate kinase